MILLNVPAYAQAGCLTAGMSVLSVSVQEPSPCACVCEHLCAPEESGCISYTYPGE